MAGWEIPRVKLGSQRLEVNLIETQSQIFECPLSFSKSCSVLLALLVHYISTIKWERQTLSASLGGSLAGKRIWGLSVIGSEFILMLLLASQTMGIRLFSSFSMFVCFELMACNWRHESANSSSLSVFRYLGWGSDVWAWVVSTTLHFPMRTALK